MGGVLAAPRGQSLARPGKNIPGLSAKMPGLPHVPYPQRSWCPQEGPRALPTTVTWLGLRKQPPPAWFQYIPPLPHSQQQPLPLPLESTTRRRGRGAQFTLHLPEHPRPLHCLTQTHRGAARASLSSEEENTKVQRGSLSCSRSHSRQAWVDN